MNKDEKNAKYFFLMLIIISLFMVTIPTKSIKSVDPIDYGSYKIKIGNSMRYKYTYINNSNGNYIETGYRMENGSIGFVNVTTDETILVTIFNVTKTIKSYIADYEETLTSMKPT